MASLSRSRRVPESRSGGKIVRPRRTASANTPYQRLNPSNSPSRSSNWLSRFVVSPTRSIATGAGKLFLSVFDIESSPTSSSSSFSGSDTIAGEEIGTFNDENNTPFQGDDTLKKSGTSEFNFSGKELQLLVVNSKSKHVIEHLLMQETFSREECDRLIKIIKSRVVDSPTNEVEGDKTPSEMPNKTLGSDTPDLCSAAVMEAKKWLKEKTSGLDSKSDLSYGSHSLNLITLPQALEDKGSPVNVAKSYMLARPPWASPSLDHINSPTPIGVQLFKETPYLISRNSTLSPKLTRDSPATESWSIQDEVRRVRSRATEQMLMTLPSSKIDWSVLSVKHTNNVNSSAVENTEASMGEKVLNITGSIDASSNLNGGGLSTQASPDLKRKWDGLQSEAVLSDPANISFEQNLAFDSIQAQQTEGSQDDSRETTAPGQKLCSLDDMVIMVHSSDGHLVKVNGIGCTNGASHQLNTVEETRRALDPRLHDGSRSVFKEMVGAEDALANGSPSSGPSFHAGQDVEQNTKTLDNKPSTVGSDHERIENGVLEQETCDVNLSDTVAINEDDGSQNSSSLQCDVQPDLELELAAPTSSTAEKQKVKRITRYNRRGKGRGVK